MPHIDGNRRKRPTAAKAEAAAVLAMLFACLGLAACGGSSKGSSTSANAAARTSTAASAGAGPAAPGAGRFKALRECLQKNGITLPNRTPGQRPPGGRGGFPGRGIGPRLPRGVTRSQYEAALKKCGGAGAFAGGRARLNNPANKQTLTKFAACMRENGVNVPEPNTSGNGPIFDTKGIDTSSPTFTAARSKCTRSLRP